MAADPSAAAIAAAEAEGEPEQRATVQVNLPSGRAILVNAPVDLNVLELHAVIHYLSGPEYPSRLDEARGQRRPSPILVPHHVARG